MRIPIIRGLIDRRLLINFRIDPEILDGILPSPFRVQVVDGYGIAGICLIRLKKIRPRFLPPVFGLSSENAAHRVAVQWDVGGETFTGVYIPRRDTSSRLTALTGGRVFPGEHHRARFDVRENGDRYRVAMSSLDGSASLLVDAVKTAELPKSSVFSSVEAVSAFFESGSVGYSPRGSNTQFDGLELRCTDWQVEPLSVTEVRSSFFDDRAVFPEGAVVFDNALLMRGVRHEWHSRDELCCT